LFTSQVCSIMKVMEFQTKSDLVQTEVKQVLGTPDQGAWSQVHHFIPNQKEKFLKRGELVLLVSLGEIAEDQPTASIGREIISRFHEEYYGSLEKKPMAALEEAAKKVAKEKSQFFDQPEEISLIGLVLWRNIAYLVIYHQGKILLRRDGKTVKLLDTEEGSPASASGFVKSGDIFVLGTPDFFEKLPNTMVPAGLSTEDLDRMVEIWGPVVHAREDQGRLGAAMIKIGSGKKQPEFITVKEEDTKKEKIKKTEKIKKVKEKLKFLKKFNPLALLKIVQKKASGLTIAVGFLILLGVSIFFGWKKRKEQQQQQKIANLSGQVEEKITNANAIRNLDPEESINLINQAEEVNQQLAEIDRQKADNYQQQMEDIKQNLGEKVLKPEAYYDMHLVGENVEMQSIFSNGQSALIYDRGGQRLIGLNLKEKSAEIIAGGEELTGQGLVAFSNNRNYFVSDRTVYWVKDEELVELKKLDENVDLVAADSWLGNLYLLDKGQKEIWKLPAITDGIGGERSWLNSKSGLDFAQLVDMAIDSNIWLLSESGQIFKYLSGKQEEFQIQLPEGIGKAEYLAVAQEAERLAFWDSEKKIIWLFSKQGTFIARQPIEVNQVSGLAISPDGTKIYLFGKDKIYLVEFSS
jgi:hypothetical protein